MASEPTRRCIAKEQRLCLKDLATEWGRQWRLFDKRTAKDRTRHLRQNHRDIAIVEKFFVSNRYHETSLTFIVLTIEWENMVKIYSTNLMADLFEQRGGIMLKLIK